MSKIILLCGALTGVLQAQTLVVTPTPLSVIFTYQSGTATLPPAQTVSLKSSSGTPAFAVGIVGTNDLWLTVSPDSGKVPVSLSVRANPTSLGVGTYTATVIAIFVGTSTSVNIPVTLNVTAPPPALTLSVATLNFVAPPNPPLSQSVKLLSNGAPVSFTAVSASPWLTVAPAAGVVLLGEQAMLTVSVDPTALIPQTAPFVGKITVAAPGAAAASKSQSITVNLTVNSVRPTITNVWPGTLPIGGGLQTITIRGTNFYAASVVKVAGVAVALKTTLLSASALSADVPAALLTATTTLNVIVTNPAPGGDSAVSAVVVANTPIIYGAVNAASYSSAALSPGELVTIFGANIGPAVPASMTITNGFVDRILGQVSVSVDGQAAPMIYVSPNQITFQVPYEVTSGSNKALIVANASNPSANTTVAIAATAPGIFTANGSGVGQAAALNYSATTMQYSLNGSTNTARIGDTVILYLTGEGNFNPLPLSQVLTNTGFVIPANLSPLPQVNPLPTVSIGGVNATVAYAGPFVGSILGLLQINVAIPAGSATGPAVSVTVSIGGNTTQANVTLAIHP